VGEGFRESIELYNTNSKSTWIDALYSPNDLSANQKFFLSVAGGAPPEITFVDGPQVAEWAARGALEPLDDLMAEVGISNNDFWPPCVRQNQYRDKTYAITYSADPNFALIWNKDLFRRVGLDPEVPPKTIEELDQFAKKLTILDSNGELDVIGFIPWNVGGMENSLFTWGWAFGGEFYNPKTNQVTCDSPEILQAMHWMLSYTKEHDLVKINSFQQTFGTGPLDPFLTGKIAISAAHVSSIRTYKKYKPDMDYGLAPMPVPAARPGESCSWMGGWCIAIPKGARDKKESMEFIKWLTTSDDGTTAMYKTTGSFPGYTKATILTELGQDPRQAVFFDILRNTKYQRPVMPAQAFYMGQLRRAVDRALNNSVTPEEVLKEAQILTQKELERVEQQYGKREDQSAS
jgi:multiple sugar transport system substrate-binding protein